MNECERLAQDIDVFLSSIGMADYGTYINTSDWQRQFPVFIEYGDIMLSSIHRMLRDAAAECPLYSDTARSLVQRLEKHMPNLARKIAAEPVEPPEPMVKMEKAIDNGITYAPDIDGDYINGRFPHVFPKLTALYEQGRHSVRGRLKQAGQEVEKTKKERHAASKKDKNKLEGLE